MPNGFPLPNRLVAIVVYDGLCTFEFGIAAEVFGLERPEMGPDWYRLVTCASEAGPLRAAGGLTVQVEHGLEMLCKAGTIVIPGWKDVGVPPPEALLSELRDAAARGARIVSLCSGAFVLAAAGLLDEGLATTHWRYADAFRDAFPGVKIDADLLYVDRGKVMTSAGSAAGIDLLLHIVRSDFGPDAANSVARRLVVPSHRDGGQAQFIKRPVPPRHDGRLAPLLDWMREHADRSTTIAALAREAAMSERTFLRRFKEMTGMTPAEWLLGVRLDRAKQMLEVGGLGIEDVAVRAGFGTSATLRMHFRSAVGISLREYRRQFGHEREQVGAHAGSGASRHADGLLAHAG